MSTFAIRTSKPARGQFDLHGASTLPGFHRGQDEEVADYFAFCHDTQLQRRRRWAVRLNAGFGGDSLTGLVLRHGWCARRQELEGPRRPRGNTRSTEFEKASRGALPTISLGALACPCQVAWKANQGCGRDLEEPLPMRRVYWQPTTMLQPRFAPERRR